MKLQFCLHSVSSLRLLISLVYHVFVIIKRFIKKIGENTPTSKRLGRSVGGGSYPFSRSAPLLPKTLPTHQEDPREEVFRFDEVSVYFTRRTSM